MEEFNPSEPEEVEDLPHMTVDAHIDFPWVAYKAREANKGGSSRRVPEMCQDNGDLCQTDIFRMRRGGLDSAFFSIYLSGEIQGYLGTNKVNLVVDEQIACLEAEKGIRVVDRVEDAIRAKISGLVPIFLGVEGGSLLNGSLDRLIELRKKKVRYLTLTHNQSNALGDSSTDNEVHGGLSSFGVAVIEEAEKLGVLIDVSHASRSAISDALMVAKGPIIATHSGDAGCFNHERNLPTWHSSKIMEKGGMVCIPFARRFVGVHSKGIAKHIDSLCQRQGDCLHVGIGSDLDGAAMVDGVEDASDWWKVTGEALSDIGYGDSEIRSITGLNLLRLLRRIEHAGT